MVVQAKQRGIKFMLRSTHFLSVPATDEEIAHYVSAYFQAKDSGHHCKLEGRCLMEGQMQEWWVWTEDIVGMHTFNIEPSSSTGSGLPHTPQQTSVSGMQYDQARGYRR